MTKVNLYKLNSEAKQELVLTFFIDEESKKVNFSGQDTSLGEDIMKNGIINYADRFQAKIFPLAGRDFLEQLKNNYKTPYLIATDVIEE